MEVQVKRTPARSKAAAGFTLLEVLLAISLFGLVGFKVYGAMTAMNQSVDEQSLDAQVEDQARRVLRQIAYEVMGSNRETLAPDAPAHLGSDSLRYQVSLGVQDGEVVWADPEQLSLEERMKQVVWSENPETEIERRVVWSNMVAPYLEGELPDGMDNNGNGLIDEKGLSFELDGNSVTVRVTLESVKKDGSSAAKTVQTTVTCRNWIDE